MQSTTRSAPSKAWNHLNAFINVSNARENAVTKGALSGFNIAVKDNICTKDLPTTCASNNLREYVSPYSATVVARIQDAGGNIVGKTNMDGFGMGSHSTHSTFSEVRNRFEHLSAGGSSGGSAVAVSTQQCHVALGTDTGGSVRLPAAFNGIYGFKPSYGRLSRWGVVAYANSLDTVGLLSKNVEELDTVFRVIDCYDEKDPTSLSEASRSKIQQYENDVSSSKPLRFGIPAEYNISELSSTVRKAWLDTLSYLCDLGHEIIPVSLPSTKQALSAYYILAPAEASSNLAKYDGVRYGSFASHNKKSGAALYASTRMQGLGDEVRRRILLGAYTLSADAIDNYFVKAQMVRRMIQHDFDKIFSFPNILYDQTQNIHSQNIQSSKSKVDALILPTTPSRPPNLDNVAAQSPVEIYAGDVFTVPASLAGIPSLNVPIAVEQEKGPASVGMQIISQYGCDNLTLKVGCLLKPLQASAQE